MEVQCLKNQAAASKGDLNRRVLSSEFSTSKTWLSSGVMGVTSEQVTEQPSTVVMISLSKHIKQGQAEQAKQT